MNFNLKKALLAGTAIVAVGGFAASANAQTTLTGNTTLGAGDLSGHTAGDDIILDSFNLLVDDTDNTAIGAVTDTGTPEDGTVTFDSNAGDNDSTDVTVGSISIGSGNVSVLATENTASANGDATTVTVTNGITTTGDVIVTGGTNANNSSDAGDIATLNVGGSISAANITITDGADGAGILNLNGSGTQTITGVVAGDGAVNVTNTGSVVFVGDSTNTGQLTVNNDGNAQSVEFQGDYAGNIDLGDGTGTDTITATFSGTSQTISAGLNGGATETVNVNIQGGDVVNATTAVWDGITTLTISGNTELDMDQALTATTVNVQTGSTLDVAANVTGNITGNGAIVVSGNSVVDGSVDAATAAVAGAHTLTIDADTGAAVSAASIDTVTLSNANAELAVGSATGETTTFTGNVVAGSGDGVNGDVTLGLNGEATAETVIFNGNVGADGAAIETFEVGGDDTAAKIATLNGNLYAAAVVVGDTDVFTFNGTGEVATIDGTADAGGEGTVNIGNGTNAATMTVTGAIGGGDNLNVLNVANNGTLNVGNNIDATTIIVNGTANVTGASTWTGATQIGYDGAATVNLSQGLTLGGGVQIGDGAGDTARLIITETATYDPDGEAQVIDAGANVFTFTGDTVTTIQLGESDSAWVAGDDITVIDGIGVSNFNTAVDDGRIVFASDSLIALSRGAATDADTLEVVVGYRDAAAAFGNASTGEGVANYLVGLGAGGTTAEQTLRNSLIGLTGEALEERAESLAPVVDGGFVVGANQAAGLSNATTNTRMAALRGGEATGMVAGEMGDGVGVWGKAFGQLAEQDERDGVAGYDADTYGFALGIDSENLMNDAVFGLSFSYGDTEVDSDGVNNTDTDIDSYQLSFYGNKDLQDNMYVSGILGYAWNDIDQTRFNVNGVANNNASADFDSDQFMLYAEFGKDFAMDNKLTLTPRVLANYQHISIDSYRETGSTANLNVSTDDMDIFEMGLGVTAAWDLQDDLGNMVKPSLSAEYRYDFVEDSVESTSSFTAGGASFRTEGFDPAQSTFELGAAVEYSMDNNWTVSADYGYTFKEDYDAHSASLRAGYKF